MSASSHQLSLPPGYVLDRYRLCELLGNGAFGITYLARDLEEGHLVAIKELLPAFMVTRQGAKVVVNSPEDQPQWDWAQQRFREEAEALLRCDHPNVLKVYCTFPANGTVYMVTRYEEGRIMEKWLRKLQNNEQRSPTEAELLHILDSVLLALEHVHGQGFLHRDIKPENIYLTNDGRVVLLDFGNARQVIATKTMPVTTILTPGYAPPEQYASAARQGGWTDLYALGATMYRAITGQVPPEAVGRKIPGMPDPCKRLAKAYAGKFSGALLQSIDRALETDYRKRIQSAEAWMMELPETEASGPGHDGSQAIAKRRGPSSRALLAHRAFFLGAGVTVVIGLLICLGFSAITSSRHDAQADFHKLPESGVRPLANHRNTAAENKPNQPLGKDTPSPTSEISAISTNSGQMRPITENGAAQSVFQPQSPIQVIAANSKREPIEFTTVDSAQKEAVRRYPELGMVGSPMNKAFIDRYHLYQQLNPQYLSDNVAWPLQLADDVARERGIARRP